jgi:hypothetical protein
MLRFSESDPDFQVDPDDVMRLEAEISDTVYERKVSGLIKRSFARDIKADPGARVIYREAYAELSKGDHYLLIMLRQALGASAPHGVSQLVAKTGLFVVLVPTTAISMLFAAALIGSSLVNIGKDPRIGAIIMAIGLVCAGASFYLVRLMIRERGI